MRCAGLRRRGDVGVDLFLVLSGFLITRMLLEERDRTGRLDLLAFYVRRMRRLAPALLVFLAVMAVLGTELWQVAASLGYVSNVLLASGVPLGSLRHMWSFAMEEQFYLVWPLVLALTLRNRVDPRWLLAGLLVVSQVWRFVLEAGSALGERMAFMPDTRAPGLIAGCLLAVMMVRRVRGPILAGAVVILVALTVSGSAGVSAVQGLICVVGCVVVVAWAATTKATLSALIPLGTVSYSVYLWQTPISDGLRVAGTPVWLVLLGTLAGSIGLATLSWWVLERPLNRRRRPDAHLPSEQSPRPAATDGSLVGGA